MSRFKSLKKDHEEKAKQTNKLLFKLNLFVILKVVKPNLVVIYLNVLYRERNPSNKIELTALHKHSKDKL